MQVMIALGVALLAVGLTVSVASGILESQAADRQRISLWGNDRNYHRSLSTVATQVAAVALIGFGAVIFVVAWGLAAIYLFVFVIVPHLLVVALHNRNIRVRQLSRGGGAARVTRDPAEPPFGRRES
jgi:hypothetical protein